MDIKSSVGLSSYAKIEPLNISKTKENKDLNDSKIVDKTKKDKAFIRDEVSITQLKAQSDEAYNKLRQIVEDLLEKQGMSFKRLQKVDGKIIDVDEATRQKAKEMIEDNGPFSPEKVSDRIVDFAKAISGGDKSKFDLLKSSIDEGFKQAEEVFGELPEISKETYSLVMDKLNDWSKES